MGKSGGGGDGDGGGCGGGKYLATIRLVKNSITTR